VLSGLLAGRLSRRITAPLNALDLEHPLENDTYEELSPLLCRINVQRQQIDRQLTDLRRRSDEFRQITSHMQEGLVLLNESGAVLSINAAACRVFGTGESCLGQDFLTVDRGRDVSDALARTCWAWCCWPLTSPSRRRRSRAAGSLPPTYPMS